MSLQVLKNESERYTNYLISEFDALNILRETAVDGKVKRETVDALMEYLVFMFANGYQEAAYSLGDGKVNPPSPNIVAKSLYEKVAGLTAEERLLALVDSALSDSEESLLSVMRSDGHRMYVAGQMEYAMEQEKLGYTMTKTWDTTLDGKARDTHLSLLGREIGIDEYFETVNGRAKAPGQFGVAVEDCNCRCILDFKRY